MSDKTDQPSLDRFTLVIPAFDEEENLPLLLEEIDRVLDSANLQCEIILVNDGSRDRTLEVMLGLKTKYSQHEVRVLTLDGNHGLSAALDAGFRNATCDVVVTIDSDLQNDPADIPLLLARIHECDAVFGVRKNRHDGFVKKASSSIANRIRNWATGEAMRDTGCTLKAFRRVFLSRIKMYDGMHRFFSSLLYMEGARIQEVEVNHRPRIHGKSKYYLSNRLIGPFRDLFAVVWMKRRNLHYRITEK